MNLLSRYYRVNIIATITVVLLTSIFYYFMIHYVLIEQLDNALKVEEQEILDFIRTNGNLPAPSSYKDQEVAFAPASAAGSVRRFSTTDSYNKAADEHEASRRLVFPVIVQGKTYDVFVYKSQEETEDLVQLIVAITLVAVVLLLLIVFLINRFVLRRLWKPFNSTLQQLEKFNLSGADKLILEPTTITEFRQLNDAVSVMTKQVSQEYDTLKRFTENASHEIQTPLAIINSKLDLLIQGENINELQMEQLQDIYNAVERLSKMNQSLLLLTRIENSQFKETESIFLETVLKEKLSQFDELISNNKIVLKTDTVPLHIKCNRQLLDILLSNLLSNAIRYNTEDGIIYVRIKEHELSISNTSLLPPLDDQQIFKRFYRHADTRKEGNGLGLSIVKQICQDFGYVPGYVYREGRHEFYIQF